MALALFDVRPEERRVASIAFFTLLGITAAHTLIETARDALFLAKIPVEHLPALYLAIAAAGLVTTRAGAAFEARRATERAPRKKPLLDPVGGALVGAALVTTLFWLATAANSPAVLYALYIYSGMFASWVAGRLWIRLGTIFTVVQAKRLYGLVGTGGVLGAVLGAAVARASLAAVEVRSLLLFGAGLLVLTAGAATMLPRGTGERPRKRNDDDDDEEKSAGLGAQIGDVVKHPYLVRILGLVLLTACAGTAVDFFFKREVATAITDKTQIAPFLATVSLATNIASLLAQAIGVGIAMRALGVHRALYVMPLLLGASAGAAVLGLGLGAALAMRGIDGTLRHSLHKTSVELLFVPLPDSDRARAKPIIDLVGQRGGQALASVALLGLAALFKNEIGVVVGGVVLALACAWLLLARGIRPRYLEVFRSTLRRGRAELTEELPELDMSALTTLIAALSSRKDAEVLGALDLLAAQQRGRLIPSLVLFHPSKPIVLRALDLFVRERSTDFVPVADRLLTHPDPEIRAAMLRARASVEPDPEFLRERLNDPAGEIRATALVALVANGELVGTEAKAALAELAEASVDVRRALARALASAPASNEALESIVVTLANDEDVETRVLAATAMGALGSRSFVGVLIALLSDRRAGLAAIEALGTLGEAALDPLDRALDDKTLADEVKWRIVRAIARSTSARAIPVLARRVVETKDIGVRARILRVLRAAQSSGENIPIDRADLEMIAEQDIAAIGRALALRLLHAKLLETRPTLKTMAGAELIQKLLRDKEIEGTERVFLVLALLYPQERFPRIQRGLESSNPKEKASSRELLENVVRSPLRDRVLALVDDAGDLERLRKIGKEMREEKYEDLLRAMIDQGGELGALAVYHAREAGLRESVKEAIEKLDAEGRAFAEELAT